MCFIAKQSLSLVRRQVHVQSVGCSTSHFSQPSYFNICVYFVRQAWKQDKE